MPDVKMPDGTIIRNVPEGTTRAQLQARVNRANEAQTTQRTAEKGSTINRSLASGMADMLTFGAGDEIGGALELLGLGNRKEANTLWSGKGSIADKWRGNQRALEAELKADQRKHPVASGIGAVGGAVVPALLTGGGSVAAQAPKAATLVGRGGQVARRLAPVAAQGAAYGFNSGSGGIVNRAKEIPKGAAFAVAGNEAGRLLGKAAARVIGGQNVPKNVRLLADEGIVLTPGQRAGKGSMRNTFEDKVLGSIPLISEVPAAAAKRGQNDLRVAVANRVLKPIGEKVTRGTPINNEAIGGIQGRVYDAYDKTLGNLSLQADDDLVEGMSNVLKNAANDLPDDQLKLLQRNANNIFDRMSRGGPVTGKALRETLSDIRTRASKNAGSSLGDNLWNLHNTIDDALARQNTPAAAGAFHKARESVTLLKRLEDAASRAGVTNGEFGPTQLASAVRRRGYGTTTGKLASGEARLADIANAASDVMRNTTANSGTVPRALAGGAVGAGASGLASMIDPTMGAATAGSLLAYVPGVDRALQNAALNRPAEAKAIAEAIRRSLPYLGAAGTGTALKVSE